MSVTPEYLVDAMIAKHGAEAKQLVELMEQTGRHVVFNYNIGALSAVYDEPRVEGGFNVTVDVYRWRTYNQGFLKDGVVVSLPVPKNVERTVGESADSLFKYLKETMIRD